MAEPTKFTVVFPDYRLQAFYSSNNTFHLVDCYICSDGSVEGNTEMKLEFANACSTLGYSPRNNFWAIQYSDGEGHIEYANGHPNTTFTGNTHISEFIKVLEKWALIKEDELNAQEIIASRPTWDDIRNERDRLLKSSDGVFTYAIETDNTVPQSWLNYRQELRDLPETFGANTGNTELVVYPTKPIWPNWS